jgi:hypothetical protein
MIRQAKKAIAILPRCLESKRSLVFTVFSSPLALLLPRTI